MRQGMFVFASLVAIGSFDPQGPARQTTPSLLPAVAGRVVDSRTGQAISGALVRLARGSFLNVSLQQVADAKGRFVFTGLEANETYILGASAFGYLASEHWSRWRHQVTTKAIPELHEIELRLSPAASIAGRVLDPSNSPVVGAFVRALLRARVGSLPVLASGPTTQTDDRGTFRLSNLPPGDYVLEMPSVQESTSGQFVLGGFPFAARREGRSDGPHPRTYHLGAPDVVRAASLSLEAGQSLEGADIRIAGMSGVSVSGVVKALPSTGSIRLRLVDDLSTVLPNGSEIAVASVGADGRFVFQNVPVGRYSVQAVPGSGEFRMSAGPTFGDPGGRLPGYAGTGGVRSIVPVLASPDMVEFAQLAVRHPASWARSTVSVGDQPVRGVTVIAQPTGFVSGKIELSGKDKAAVSRVGLSVSPALDNDLLVSPPVQMILPTPVGGVRPAESPWSFSISGLTPGKYYLSSTTPGVVLRAVRTAGRAGQDNGEFTVSAGGETELTAEFSTEVASIQGVVARTGSSPVGGLLVICFARRMADDAGMSFQPRGAAAVVVEANGSYRLSDLPAGEYFLAVIDPTKNGPWNDEERLRSLGGVARRVELGWGERRVFDLEWRGR